MNLKFMKLLMVAIFASMSFALTSCGDDDEPSSEGGDLIGTWQGDGLWGEFAGAFGGTAYIQFQEDGTAISVMVGEGFPNLGIDGEVDVERGKWSLSGNTLTIDGEKITVKSLSSSKLVVEAYGIEVEYKKVPDSTIDKYLDPDYDPNSGRGKGQISYTYGNGSSDDPEAIWYSYYETSGDDVTFSAYIGEYGDQTELRFSTKAPLREMRKGKELSLYSLCFNDPLFGINNMSNYTNNYTGKVTVEDKSTNSITLKFENLKFESIPSREQFVTFNGRIVYTLE